MSIRSEDIESADSDEKLFKLLSAELQRLLPPELHEDDERLLQTISELPRGLRAMASIYKLDVSMTTDDLGWHLYNFHNWNLCEEAHQGLIELEASEAAEIFSEAMKLTEPHWYKIGSFKTAPSQDFATWYESSGLEALLNPLNQRLWKIISARPNYGLLRYWLDYARKYPDRIACG